ncbi:MAG: EAL domain-containing protein [Synechococcus sp.]
MFSMQPFWLQGKQGVVLRELRRIRRKGGPKPAVMSGAAAVLLVLSAAGLGWRGVALLRSELTHQAEVSAGLLEMRSRAHRILAGDWGRWQATLDYVQSQDPAYLRDEVRTSTLIQDGQILLITRLDGTVLYNSAAEFSDGSVSSDVLLHCLENKLNRLPVAPSIPLQQTWGVYCRFAETSVIGAVSAVTNNTSTHPAAGWLLHLSPLQRPSYSPALNRAFALIGRQTQAVSTEWLPLSHRESLPEVDQLQDEESVPLGLTQGLSLADCIRAALVMVVMPWLLIWGVLGLAAVSWLGYRRQTRLFDIRHRRLLEQRARLLEQQNHADVQQMHAHLLQRFGPERGPLFLGVIRGDVHSYHARYSSRAEAHDTAMVLLKAEFEQSVQATCSFGVDRELLVGWPCATPASETETLITGLEGLLQGVIAKVSDHMQLDCRMVLVGADREGDWIQALLDLSLVLQSDADVSSMVRWIPSNLRGMAATCRHQISRDLELSVLAGRLDGHGYHLEPTHHVGQSEGPSGYGELLFRVPRALQGKVTIQDLFLSLERSRKVHLIDLLMLRQSIKLLREEVEGQPLPHCLATNLSAATLQDKQSRRQLVSEVRSQSLMIRERLVFEITETAFLGDRYQWMADLEELRSLGVRFAIDDFGVGHASLGYLFLFDPDFVKLDLRFSQTLEDPDVDALVEFLLRYCRHHKACLILEGIESERQLAYWVERGVTDFQGYLFASDERLSSFAG